MRQYQERPREVATPAPRPLGRSTKLPSYRAALQGHERTPTALTSCDTCRRSCRCQEEACWSKSNGATSAALRPRLFTSSGASHGRAGLSTRRDPNIPEKGREGVEKGRDGVEETGLSGPPARAGIHGAAPQPGERDRRPPSELVPSGPVGRPRLDPFALVAARDDGRGIVDAELDLSLGKLRRVKRCQEV